MKKMILLLFIIVCFQAITVFAQWEHKYQALYEQCFLELNGKFYQGFTNGISIYDIENKKRQFFSMINSDLPGNYINSFLLLKDNSILVGTNGGLAVIENGIISANKPICSTYPDNDARFLYKDDNSNIWTFSAKKVHLYKDNQWRTFDLSTQSIPFSYEILELFIDGNEALALFNNKNKSTTTFYYSKIQDLHVSIAKINENGIYELWLDKKSFPYRQAGYSFIRVGDELWLQNYDSVYTYKNQTWQQNKTFNFGDYKPYFISSSLSLQKDKLGRIWTVLEDTKKKIRVPAVFDPTSKQVTVHLENENQSYFYLSILSDGRVIAWNNNNIFIFDIDKNAWEKRTAISSGVPQNCYFGRPRIINNKIYVYLTAIYSNYKYDYSYYGNLLCIDDQTTIPKIYEGLPYASITQFAINKKGQGIYQGRFIGEELQYQTSTEFIKPRFYSNVVPTIPTYDGNVYFTKLQVNNQNLYSTIATWDDTGMNYLDMGFIEKGSDIESIDSYQENIITFGSYSYDSGNDSLTTCLSIYNTKNKTLNKYDRFNSDLPDYYYLRDGIFRMSMDTVPLSFSADNDGNIWLMTSMSLIKFKDGKSLIYDLPKSTTGKPITNIIHIHFDGNTKQILGYYESFESYNYPGDRKLYYFDIITSQWDSIETKDAGFIGKFVRLKKLLDGNVWACDNLGYLYKYSGDGKFIVFDLRINDNPNLRFQINDFMIDVNGYLHLGTDIGILTNRSILLNVEDKLELDGKLLAYPNPFNSQIYIDHTAQNIMELELIDIFGRSMVKAFGTNVINTESVPSGIYILRVKTSNNDDQSVKVIKL